MLSTNMSNGQPKRTLYAGLQMMRNCTYSVMFLMRISMLQVRPRVSSTSWFADCMQRWMWGSWMRAGAWHAASDMVMTWELGLRTDLTYWLWLMRGRMVQSADDSSRPWGSQGCNPPVRCKCNHCRGSWWWWPQVGVQHYSKWGWGPLLSETALQQNKSQALQWGVTFHVWHGHLHCLLLQCAQKCEVTFGQLGPAVSQLWWYVSC